MSADPYMERAGLDALADEIELWGQTIAAQRLLQWQMFHAPTEADQRRAATVALYLFGDGAALRVAA